MNKQQPEDVIGPMREIAAISARLEEGASVTEVNAAYEAHEFPELERVESQMAMLKAVERVGSSSGYTSKQVVIADCGELKSKAS